MHNRQVVRNTADPEQIAEADRARKLGLSTEDEDLMFIMASKQGRRFIWNQLARAGIFQASYVHRDAHGTAFNEGKRNNGLRLFGKVQKLCPELYVKAAEENFAGTYEVEESDNG